MICNGIEHKNAGLSSQNRMYQYTYIYAYYGYVPLVDHTRICFIGHTRASPSSSDFGRVHCAHIMIISKPS